MHSRTKSTSAACSRTMQFSGALDIFVLDADNVFLLNVLYCFLFAVVKNVSILLSSCSVYLTLVAEHVPDRETSRTVLFFDMNKSKVLKPKQNFRRRLPSSLCFNDRRRSV